GAASFFDTLRISVASAEAATAIVQRAYHQEVNLRRLDETTVGISLDETTGKDALLLIAKLFESPQNPLVSLLFTGGEKEALAQSFHRRTSFLSHPVFNSYHSETEMLRYIKKL